MINVIAPGWGLSGPGVCGWPPNEPCLVGCCGPCPGVGGYAPPGVGGCELFASGGGCMAP